jgi:P pilus assembly chaperone PapD
MRPILAALCLVAFAFPALAQIERLPTTSRAEAQANAINNSLVNEGRNRAAAQQNQFEINSLRNESSRAVIAPPIVVAPPIAGPAPVGR